ncbi:hypothetical protein D3C79_873700 [compost metagenome]
MQRSHAQEGSEDHYADDRGRAGAGQIGKRVFRHERQHQLRYGQIRHFTYVVALDGRHARAFLRALHQAFRGQAKQVGHQHTHQRGDKRGEQQGTDSQETDFAQRRGIMQLGYRAQD